MPQSLLYVKFVVTFEYHPKLWVSWSRSVLRTGLSPDAVLPADWLSAQLAASKMGFQQHQPEINSAGESISRRRMSAFNRSVDHGHAAPHFWVIPLSRSCQQTGQQA